MINEPARERDAASHPKPDSDVVERVARLRAAAELGLEWVIEAANERKQKDSVFDNAMRDIKRIEDALEATAALNASTPEMQAALAVVEAARHLPRATPGAGSANTVHDFKIEAWAVWDLDRALTNFDKLKQDASHD